MNLSLLPSSGTLSILQRVGSPGLGPRSLCYQGSFSACCRDPTLPCVPARDREAHHKRGSVAAALDKSREAALCLLGVSPKLLRQSPLTRLRSPELSMVCLRCSRGALNNELMESGERSALVMQCRENFLLRLVIC